LLRHHVQVLHHLRSEDRNVLEVLVFNFFMYYGLVETTQWPKEKGQKSTKHTHKTKDRVLRTPLKTGGELMCSGSVDSS
jgi:hypothetical protein